MEILLIRLDSIRLDYPRLLGKGARSSPPKAPLSCEDSQCLLGEERTSYSREWRKSRLHHLVKSK